MVWKESNQLKVDLGFRCRLGEVESLTLLKERKWNDETDSTRLSCVASLLSALSYLSRYCAPVSRYSDRWSECSSSSELFVCLDWSRAAGSYHKSCSFLQQPLPWLTSTEDTYSLCMLSLSVLLSCAGTVFWSRIRNTDFVAARSYFVPLPTNYWRLRLWACLFWN